MNSFSFTRVGILRVAAPAVAVALFASACASGGGGGSSTSAPAGGGGNAAGAVMIESHSGPMGTFLTDSSGKSLYMFAKDSATKSNCSSVCAVYWPPLTDSSAVHASGSVSSSKITTITRSDGSKQVVYAGHPLYYFKLDTTAGDTKGEGVNNFGAKWWLVAPSGQPITNSGSGSSSSSSPSSSSSSSGGGGSWG